jgi:hypothetical protein
MESEQSGRKSIDLAEVAGLIEALERDLAKVRQGSGDVATLRGEVEQLRAALQSPGDAADKVQEVHEGLHGIRTLIHKVGDELVGDALKGADYVARIGRLLGM